MTDPPAMRLLISAMIVMLSTPALSRRAEAQSSVPVSVEPPAPARVRPSVGYPERSERFDARTRARWRDGTLVTLRGDSLVVVFDGADSLHTTVGGPWEVEVNPSARGSRDSHVMLGAAIGVAVGTALALSGRCTGTDGPPCGALKLAVAPLVGLIGAVAGGTIGALLPAEHWTALSRR